MNYSKIYNQIINGARARPGPICYTERHHIIPKALGGNNLKENIVTLTAREHFICHWLLTKFTEGQDKHKMLYAMNGLLAINEHQDARYKPTSRTYAYLKSQLFEVKSKRMKENNPMHNPIHKAKHAAVMKTRVMIGMTGQTHSEETKRKMSEASKNQVVSEETKKKISIAAKRQHADPNYINPMHLPGAKAKHAAALKLRSARHWAKKAKRQSV